jgi:hypothetical protein
MRIDHRRVSDDHNEIPGGTDRNGLPTPNRPAST